MTKQSLRLAIVDNERCKPKKCNKECKKRCPVVGSGKECVVVDIESIAKIDKDMCVGCGLCVKACPFNAIQIVNLPGGLDKDIFHDYGENSFKLYRFPIPKIGKVYGIIGQNGIGKSSIMSILNGRLVPNFGKCNECNKYNECNECDENPRLSSNRIKGLELQKYFDNITSLTIKTKPQNIDKIQKLVSKKNPDKTVYDALNSLYNCENPFHQQIVQDLGLEPLFGSKIGTLSGGEMQRFVCGTVLMQDADVYIFDEPSNYLDIKQRLAVANLIRSLIRFDRYIFLVEHDMSILDYTSDIISVMYGVPGAYGVISTPYATAEAINIFFNGYIPSDNIKFRQHSYNFNGNDIENNNKTNNNNIVYKDGRIETNKTELGVELSYSDKIVEYDNFQLNVTTGTIPLNIPIVVLLGKNGTGKTTFLNSLSKELDLAISYKTQYIDFQEKDNGINVKDYLFTKIRKAMCSNLFVSDVIKPLDIPNLYDKDIGYLSGGELQRLAITICLGTDADIYLIDEPSASLDIEQRVNVTKIIKRFLLHNHKIGFIVEHDIMMVMSLCTDCSSRVVVFEEKQKNNKRVSYVTQPLLFGDGINRFLEMLGVTFRNDFRLKRPRINKQGSQKDVEQKMEKKYYV